MVVDLSKRYGNLKGGVDDIKQHKWFNKINWKELLNKKEQVFYKPLVKYKKYNFLGKREIYQILVHIQIQTHCHQ